MSNSNTRCNDLVDRLRGIYRLEVNDVVGLYHEKCTFTRTFPASTLPPIQAEAADEIERLRADLAEAKRFLTEAAGEWPSVWDEATQGRVIAFLDKG